jgi:hypothetical protein
MGTLDDNDFCQATAGGGIDCTIDTIPVADGGTGAVTESAARTALDVPQAGTLTDGDLCRFQTANGIDCDVTNKAGLETAMSDVADFAEADGDVYTGAHDFGTAGTFLEIPNGTAEVVSGATGRITLDTTDEQIILRGASADIVVPTRQTKCFPVESLIATDELGVWIPDDAVAITQGWCSCFGPNCGTTATFVFSDDVGGVDMAGTVTCSDYPTLDSKTAISGSNTLAAFEGLVIDLTNTPTADGQYSMCWEFTTTRE